MGVHGFGKTDVGRVRESNEDAFFVDDELGLYVVSDGMGGAQGGEIASQRATATVAEAVRRRRDTVERLATDPTLAAEVGEILRSAIVEASGAILGAARNAPELAGMGCTVTALVVRGRTAVIAHVGDSRAYVRGGKGLEQITSDHTLAAEMVRAGAMPAVDAGEHAFSHILTRAVGTREEVEVDVVIRDTEDVDAILLCSDGLTDHAADTEWLVGEMTQLKLDDVPDALITHANEAGGEDNITVIVVGVKNEDRMWRRGLLGRIDRWIQKRKTPATS